jgi:hypothetical protein
MENERGLGLHKLQLDLDTQLRKILLQQSKAKMGLYLSETYYLGSLLFIDDFQQQELLRRVQKRYTTFADSQLPLKFSYTELCIIRKKPLLISKLTSLLNLTKTVNCDRDPEDLTEDSIDFHVYGKLFVAAAHAKSVQGVDQDRFGSNASVFYSSSHFNHPLSKSLDSAHVESARKDVNVSRTSTFTLVELETTAGKKYDHPVELIAFLVAFNSTKDEQLPEIIEPSERCFALVRYLNRAEPKCDITTTSLWRTGSPSCVSAAQFLKR